MKADLTISRQIQLNSFVLLVANTTCIYKMVVKARDTIQSSLWF